jgi:hypothetical protein
MRLKTTRMHLERTYAIEIPVVSIPASMVFAHSTRMADFDTPDIERIVQPSSQLPRHTVDLRVATGVTTTRAETRSAPRAPYGRLKHEVKRVLHRREPEIDLGNGFALDMRFAYLGNFAHLVHDVLGPLRFIEKTLKEDSSVPFAPVHVIIPKKEPLAARFLEAAGVPTIQTDGIVRGNLVTITERFNLALLPHLARQPFAAPAGPTRDRLFVSRRGARVVLNEDAVTRFLADQGFERVYMEDFSIAEQWSMLAHAKEVVGIHGAGLASLAFSIHRQNRGVPRFRLIELFSPGYMNTCFRIYSAILDGSWVGVRGKITPEVVRDLDLNGQSLAHQLSSFDVDLASLSEALDYSRKQPGAGPQQPAARV